MGKLRCDPLNPGAALALVSENELQLSDSENGRRLECVRHLVADASGHDPESSVILNQVKCFARGGWLLHDLRPEAGALTLFKQPIANLGLHPLG